MKWQGLITDIQHRAGYGSTQDEDFLYIGYGRNGTAGLVATLLFEIATIKQVRELIEQDGVNQQEIEGR